MKLYFKLFIYFTVYLLSGKIVAQNSIPDDFCMSNNELNLFDRINLLRVDYDESILQLSASLSYVAQLHIDDLINNNPDTSICNYSSWSDKGNWTPCCYNNYIYNPDCMWDKPKELTPYRYRGYELVTFFENEFNNDSIINLWSDSKEVLDMILTRGDYSKKKWICGGVAINKNYVSLWFGQRKDYQKSPVLCNNETRLSDTLISNVDKPNVAAYYLIFGSYTDMHTAKNMLRKVKSDEFENAEILSGNNKIRLSLDKFSSLKEAMYAKQQLPFKYNEAWILKY